MPRDRRLVEGAYRIGIESDGSSGWSQPIRDIVIMFVQFALVQIKNSFITTDSALYTLFTKCFT